MNGAPREPAYFTLPVLLVERGRPAPREAGLRGRLTVRVTCRTELHIGSGTRWVHEANGARRLVGGVVGLRDASGRVVPIVPGTSWKGAVRAVAEALTPSCERVVVREAGAPSRCRPPDALCPACQIFGAPGWRATLGFGDLAPADGWRLAPRLVPQRYSHRDAPRRGRRLYRRQPEEPLPDQHEELLVVPSGAAFQGALYLDGVHRAGLGLVLLALGAVPQGLPYLRLGGGKNRGLGIVDVTIIAGRVYESWQGWLRGERIGGTDLQQLIGNAAEEALSAYPVMAERIALVRRNYAPDGESKR